MKILPMRNLTVIILTVITLLVSSVAMSANQSLQESYNKIGIDNLVVELLKEGISPDTIVKDCIEIEGLNPQNLVKALYCAGVTGEDVRKASEKYGISEPMIVAGYKKSIDECGDRVEDSQAYTPVSTGPSFAGPSAGRSGSSVVYASPSAF